MEPTIKDLGKIMMTMEGEYNPEREYEILSVVSFEDISYISKKNVPSNIPVTNKEYWQFFGSLGNTPKLRSNIETEYIEVSYDNGEHWKQLIALSEITGPQGIQGAQGPKGEPAVAIENYITAEATLETIDIIDILPSVGSADTVYRVSNWDGVQYNETTYSEYGWYDNAYKKLATRQIGIDNEPIVDSQNLVKSGGVAAQISQLGQQVIYDVSANNGGATFASLSALLSSGNLSTLIPTPVRHGGMSIRFVQSSDNKYIQARCMAQNFTTDVADWQAVDDVPTAESENLVKSGGVKKYIDDNFVRQDEGPIDLDISDENNNTIARFSNGHIKTKNFDSYETATNVANNTEAISALEEKTDAIEDDMVNTPSVSDCGCDFAISDENNNDILILRDGHIRTKNFNSSVPNVPDGYITTNKVANGAITEDKLEKSHPYEGDGNADLDITDNESNIIARFTGGHIRTKNFDSSEVADGIKRYNTQREALAAKDSKVVLVGSQLIKHNTEAFTQPSSNITGCTIMRNQYTNIGLNSTIPIIKKKGYVQSFAINNNECEIIGMSKHYLYVRDATETQIGSYSVINNNVIYRIPFTDKIGTIDVESLEYTIIDLTNKLYNGTENRFVTKVFELEDCNIIVETKQGNAGKGSQTQKILFKVDLTTNDYSVTMLFSTPFAGQVYWDWGFDQYDNIVLMSTYGRGKTAEIWLSQDYGETFNCIFHVTNRITNNNTDWGDDIYPQPENIIPAQASDFWTVPSSANGNAHIHCCRYDPIDKRIYAAMGDYMPSTSGYSAIWYTDDFGEHWHIVHPGGQCLVMRPLRNCMLITSDGLGNGIWRKNHYKQGEEPIFELVYQDDEATTPMSSIGSSSTVDGNNAFFIMSPSPESSIQEERVPYGNLVWTDGYNFQKIYTDQFADGVRANYKLDRHNLLNAVNGNIYIALSIFASADYTQFKEVLVLNNIY